MEKKISGSFFKFLFMISVFSILLFTSGKSQAEAALMCSVKFNNIQGTSTSTVYSKLNMEVPKDTVIVLPDIVTAAGYRNLGWSTVKGKTTPLYKFGTKVRVIGNVTFYLVREKIVYRTATFCNSAGGTNAAYQKMAQKVEKGTVITLPSVKAGTGYVNLGWSTVKGKTSPLYAFGSKYTLTANTTFYLIRKRTYNVTFSDNDGSTGADFENLNQTVTTGTSIKLPEAPVKDGYACLGWSTSKNASTAEYKVGSALKITKNTSLYAVYASGVILKFMSNDGTRQVGSLAVVKGEVVKLIGYHENGSTMMGWSTKPNQTLNATYAVGQSVTLKKDYTLYAVMFSKKNEVNLSPDDIPQVDTRNYTKVILVGDSRTSLMKEQLQKEMPAKYLNGMVFICKKGSGLSWLKSTAYNSLLKEIGNGGTAKKPIAVIFNHGVNDLLSVTDYIKYMKQIAPVLKEKNCKLYYMSVNPVNNVVLTNRGLNVPEERVRSFNSKIKTYLCYAGGPYVYLDTHTELYKTGFGHDNGAGKDDGLHYTAATYKRIYAYMVKALSQK